MIRDLSRSNTDLSSERADLSPGNQRSFIVGFIRDVHGHPWKSLPGVTAPHSDMGLNGESV